VSRRRQGLDVLNRVLGSSHRGDNFDLQAQPHAGFDRHLMGDIAEAGVSAKRYIYNSSFSTW